MEAAGIKRELRTHTHTYTHTHWQWHPHTYTHFLLFQPQMLPKVRCSLWISNIPSWSLTQTAVSFHGFWHFLPLLMKTPEWTSMLQLYKYTIQQNLCTDIYWYTDKTVFSVAKMGQTSNKQEKLYWKILNMFVFLSSFFFCTCVCVCVCVCVFFLFIYKLQKCTH